MNVTVNQIDVSALLRWSKPKELDTKRGVRILRKAKPTEDFWALWAARKSALQAAGVSVSDERQYGGDWVVCWWTELSTEELARRAESEKASWAAESDAVIPAPPGCEYRPFQKAGIEAMSRRPNNLLADAMGLGKTIQVVGLCNNCEDINRVLIVTKATLKMNWYRELRKWLVRPLSIGIADSKCFPSTDVVIINYDICHKFAARLEFYWDLVALDECQYVKNPRAVRTKSVLGYKPTRAEAAAGVKPSSGIPAKRKVGVSGTPFENRPAELYPILRWLLGDQCPSKSAFEKKYCGAGMSGFGWQANGASNLESLRSWLRQTVMIRRLKQDVLKELPPKTRIVVELDGAEDAVTSERMVCQKYEADLARAQVEYELIKTLESDAEYEARRKALNQQFYVPFTEIAKVRHATALAKVPLAVEAIKDDLEEMGSVKCLCFAHHKDVLQRMAKEFPHCVVVHGEMSLPERDQAVQRFQNDPTCGPFFGSIRATGEGLTLTAASLVVFVEEDWVPGKITQCEDRAHRIGQRDNVLVKHLVLKGTLDAKMVTTNVRKQEVLDVALDSAKAEEMMEPVLVPRHESLATRRQIRVEASIVTAEQRRFTFGMLVAFCLAVEAATGQRDEVGEIDLAIARALKDKGELTGRETVLGRKVLMRYQKLFSLGLAGCGGFQGAKDAVFAGEDNR